jgi:phosphoadenosine phosphosulfate reductase
MYPKALSYLNYNISDLCCEKLKKAPLKCMAKRMQTQCSIIGTLAEESQVRKTAWMALWNHVVLLL